MIAAVAYGGFFLGWPLGVIPLLMRDDDFALYHGRHATALWLVHFVMVMALTMVLTVIGFLTCGFGYILFPVIFIPVIFGMISSVHGLVLALNGERKEPIFGMGLGEMLFSSITLKDDMGPPPSLPGDSP